MRAAIKTNVQKVIITGAATSVIGVDNI